MATLPAYTTSYSLPAGICSEILGVSVQLVDGTKTQMRQSSPVTVPQNRDNVSFQPEDVEVTPAGPKKFLIVRVLTTKVIL